ncbi:thioredoxin domain-containing protein [Anthonomus grandis grandis]|uniref:thioredoxin domain-containing protein n=1 Tax=Anthonomus grandis grandis TaxID=2921223 RepID=UPI002164F1D7|nr:thioredoxin domain-containing protein [Anthonomus grandis grandis]
MKLLTLLFLSILTLQVRSQLELIQDDELVNLIRSEKYVVALFTKKYCEECENYENELTGLREDLVETLNAWVVKLVDSSMLRLYTPSKEPQIVFFRHGIPLLYDGPLNDELILHTFTNNKEPAVKELNDDNFEHLTQAASGATTGDWFVQFYTTDCVDCQRLQARWEAVGAHLKSRMNVARVNRATTGAKTARRFDIFEVPTFVLFKQGKMYRYHNQDFEIKSFVAFAQDWYKNMKSERVPVPKSPFDDLVAATVTFMKENPYLWQVGFGSLLLGILLPTIMKFFKKSTKEEKSSNKSSQKKASTKKPVKKE